MQATVGPSGGVLPYTGRAHCLLSSPTFFSSFYHAVSFHRRRHIQAPFRLTEDTHAFAYSHTPHTDTHIRRSVCSPRSRILSWYASLCPKDIRRTEAGLTVFVPPPRRQILQNPLKRSLSLYPPPVPPSPKPRWPRLMPKALDVHPGGLPRRDESELGPRHRWIQFRNSGTRSRVFFSSCLTFVADFKVSPIFFAPPPKMNHSHSGRALPCIARHCFALEGFVLHRKALSCTWTHFLNVAQVNRTQSVFEMPRMRNQPQRVQPFTWERSFVVHMDRIVPI